MPFAEAQAQTPFFPTHTLMCAFRFIFIILHDTCGRAKLTAMFFVICGYQGFVFGHAVREADLSKRVLSF